MDYGERKQEFYFAFLRSMCAKKLPVFSGLLQSLLTGSFQFSSVFTDHRSLFRSLDDAWVRSVFVEHILVITVDLIKNRSIRFHLCSVTHPFHHLHFV